MEAAAGFTLDAAGVGLAHAIYRETDGNPFFLGEVLRHLVETNTISQDATGRWTAVPDLNETALPTSVHEVVGARVARLGPAAGRALALASVIGRDFDLEILARAAETTEDELLDVLDQAMAAALVRELADTPGRYTFAHALIQRTLYQDLGPTRRSRAHRRVAEAIEDVCGDHPGLHLGDLARHWFNATQSQDLEKALRYSRQAAESALVSLAPDDALRYFTQALDIVSQIKDPDPGLILDLTIGVGTAQRQMGNSAFRETLIRAARAAIELDDTPHLVAAALAGDRGIGIVGSIDTERVEILEIAAARLASDDLQRATLLATLCSELPFRSPP